MVIDILKGKNITDMFGVMFIKVGDTTGSLGIWVLSSLFLELGLFLNTPLIWTLKPYPHPSTLKPFTQPWNITHKEELHSHHPPLLFLLRPKTHLNTKNTDKCNSYGPETVSLLHTINTTLFNNGAAVTLWQKR